VHGAWSVCHDGGSKTQSVRRRGSLLTRGSRFGGRVRVSKTNNDVDHEHWRLIISISVVQYQYQHNILS